MAEAQTEPTHQFDESLVVVSRSGDTLRLEPHPDFVVDGVNILPETQVGRDRLRKIGIPALRSIHGD